MAQAAVPLTRDAQVEALKLPPYSVPAEQAVLGGLLLDNSAWDKIGDVISESDFYRADHRQLYHHIASLIGDSKPADVLTVAESLQRAGKLEEVGGQPYIDSLAVGAAGAVNIRRYGEIVRDLAIMRRLAEVGQDIAESVYNPLGRSAKGLLDHAEQQVFEIAEAGAKGRKSYLPVRDLLGEVVQRIDTLYKDKNAQDIIGVATGFADLDRMTSGLQGSNLIVVAGRPGTGKTSLCMNIVEHVALEVRMPVAVFSLEMSGAELALRMISSLARIDQSKLRTGRLQDDDWLRVNDALRRLNDAAVYIDDTAAINPLELRSRARRIFRECGGPGLGLIVVDYLQLMSVADSRNQENRATQVAEISRSLKALAKELNVPIIALSQLNRNPEKRDDRRPQMSDIRESGAVEQDADIVLLISRSDPSGTDPAERRKAELIVAKHRNGPTGTIQLTFLNEITRFENYADPDRF